MIRKLMSSLLLSASLAVTPLLAAETTDPLVAGRNYQTLASPVATSQPDKIEVVALFSYSCPHCYRLEPTLADMEKDFPEDVAMVRMPAMFGGLWDLLGQLYYSLEVLKVDPSVHAGVFNAIHEQKRNLNNFASMSKLVAELGVDEKRFEKAWKSPSVEARMKTARQRAAQYGISGVPSMVVNGKYLFDVGMAGSPAQVPFVANSLIERERQLSQ